MTFDRILAIIAPMSEVPGYSPHLAQRLEEQESVARLAGNVLDERKSALDESFVGLDLKDGMAIVDYIKAIINAIEQTQNSLWVSSMMRAGIAEELILDAWDRKDEKSRELGSTDSET